MPDKPAAKSNERGNYGSVRRVLLDGPDFQKLTSSTRWALVALKIGMGASGIEVAYLPAIAAVLSARTGLSLETVNGAIGELDVRGWIRVEGNVLWLVGHLDHDPHLSPDDAKHRKGIQRHVAGLPRLDIVRDFIQAHPSWFPTDEALAHGLGWAIEGPSKGHRSTEPETETDTEIGVVAAPTEYARSVTAAANAAARQKWNAEPFPQGTTQSFTLAQDCMAKGIPLPDAVQRLVNQIASCGLERPPRTIRYFLPGILEPNPIKAVPRRRGAGQLSHDNAVRALEDV